MKLPETKFPSVWNSNLSIKNMKLLKPLGILAALYCCLGPLLLLAGTKFGNISLRQSTLAIILLAVFFFSYSLVSLAVFHKLLAQKSKVITTYYLGEKTVRLLICIGILIVYALFQKEGLVNFTMDIAAFYLVTMVYTSYYCIKEERRNKN